ncbi:MAG: PD40 domain-containing protein [Anaerolineaceae bacterium]|nr:PD40 domain-containing protein [Anaerolineaceae bacterium]
MKYLLTFIALISSLALAACQPQAEVVALPTLIDLNGTVTQEAAETATAVAQLPPTRQPLPATWTPSPPPAPATVPAVQAESATPEQRSDGFIYYIFNNDSIVRLFADGSFEDLIMVGDMPQDLTIAPDGSLLAFSAQGNGSAREVFVLKTDGSYRQQVSCLGYARIIKPVWSPDSQTLAFGASQTVDGPVSIYTANIVGSGQCPSGNNQQEIASLGSNRVNDLVWDSDGRRIYFTMAIDDFKASIFAADTGSHTFSPRLTYASGFGPDSSPAPDPLSHWLYYLKSTYNMDTKQVGGVLYQFDRENLTPPINEIEGADFFATRLRWSPAGGYLLIETANAVFLLDRNTNSTVEVVRDTTFPPQAAMSPDDSAVVYVNGGETNFTVQQIYRVSRIGDERQQLTFHGEGSINNPVWGAN